MQMVAHAANGLTAGEIAVEEGISIFTVRSHLNAARSRAGARNITHLVAIAIANGALVYDEDSVPHPA